MEQHEQKVLRFPKNKKTPLILIAIIAVVIVLLVLFPKLKTAEMKGQYNLTSVSVNDWEMDSGTLTGELDVTGVDNNSISSLFFYDSSTQDLTMGYIVTAGETADYIKYKFWVGSHQGNFLLDGMDYFYIYFYPKENRVMVDGGEMKLYFTR